jgi:hypothetical protein
LDRCPRVYTSPSLTGVRAAARFDREGAEAIVESGVAALSHSAATSLESRPAESAKHKLPLTPTSATLSGEAMSGYTDFPALEPAGTRPADVKPTSRSEFASEPYSWSLLCHARSNSQRLGRVKGSRKRRDRFDIELIEQLEAGFELRPAIRVRAWNVKSGIGLSR